MITPKTTERSTSTKVRRPRSTPVDVDFSLLSQGTAPLYLQVQSVISDHISEGRLNEGDRLPSLQQLSEEMGIAYATVARGVRTLVQSGALEARIGSGTHVASPRQKSVHRTGVLSTFPANELIAKTRYYRSLLFMLQETLVQRGQIVVYNRWDGETDLEEVIENLQPLDSIILFAAPPERLDQIKAVHRKLPLVCLGDMFSDPSVPTVQTTNDLDAARMATLLFEAGHNCVALLAPIMTDSYTVEQRVKGFREKRQALGAQNDVELRGTPEEWTQQLLALKEKPTAIVMPDYMWTFSRVFELLRGTQLELGRHTEVAVWDENLWHCVTPYNIAFWSVEQSLAKIANTATEELSRMMREPAYRSGLLRYESEIARVEANGSRKIWAKE